jgi:glycosyltransferase involved in cell wall biosynthesis
VGRLVPGKGTSLLLQAIAGAVKSGLDLCLYVVGSGPERERLQTLTHDLNLSKHVHFHGTLSRHGVRRVLQRAHGYVLASHHETFGIPVVEALACGCTVLATRCGGPEYVLSSDAGLLVETKSVAALQNGLKRLTHRLLHSAPSSPVSRSALHNRFSYDTFVMRTHALYQAAQQHAA